MAAKNSNDHTNPVNGHASSVPIYLHSYEIHGIRCFRGPSQRIDFTHPSGSWAPWTLIVGNNGTGKSTLLQRISNISLQRYDSGQGFPPRIAFEMSEEFMYPGWPLLRRSIEEQRQLESGDFNDKTTWERAVLLSGKKTARVWQLFRLSPEGEALSIGGNSCNLARSVGDLAIFGYGAWRSLGESELRPRNPFGPQCPHLFGDASDLINAEEWLLRLDYGAEHPSRYSEVNRLRFEQVKDTLIELLPEVSAIRLAEPTGPERLPRLVFRTPYGEVELRRLGYGYQSLIAWVVDFAARMYQAYPNSPDPIAEPAICLIDEIDLHLHPSWQRELMTFLSKRFPKTQFIATAHSPLVVQAAEEVGANVVLLRREGDHVVIDNDPISVKGWRVDQILASELFEETPALAGEAAEMMSRRNTLLRKPRLTAKENAELKALNEKAESLPVGTTAKEIELNDRLKNAVELLEKAAKDKKK
jgi:energy-coupling factor transporter ATP-binding protein EcfA2